MAVLRFGVPKTRRVAPLIAVGTCLVALACGSSTRYERDVQRLFSDARNNDPNFALHFSKSFSPDDIAQYRQTFADKKPPKVELEDGPWCVRAYWGEYVIDESYFIFYALEESRRVIVSAQWDSGFGAAMGGLFSHGESNPGPSLYDRCVIANNAASGPSP